MNRVARIRLWLAQTLLRGLPVEITRAEAWRETEADVFDALGFVRRSGHLNRVYHAGVVLRLHLQKVLTTLGKRAPV